MDISTKVTNLTQALQLFHIKVDNIKKDAKNPFFKSSYASLSNILDSIKDPLSESGLLITQFPTGNYGLTTILFHAESGEFLSSTFEMVPEKDTPQGRGSCISYMRRYSISAILLLNIEEDDDANIATFGGKTPQEAEQDNKKWLNKGTKEFDFYADKLKNKETTMQKIREHWKVNKEVEGLLLQTLL
jgi:predicted transposase YbfD/YdcC